MVSNKVTHKVEESTINERVETRVKGLEDKTLDGQTTTDTRKTQSERGTKTNQSMTVGVGREDRGEKTKDS